MKTKTITFSRPVQIADIDWEIEAPTEIIDQGEKAIIEWIMTNKNKLKRIGNYPETYTLKEEISPERWKEWQLTINPAINIENLM